VSYPEPNDFNALRHLCLVKITTDDGVVGWGESITQFPEASFATKAIVDGMAARVVGRDPLENQAIWLAIKDQTWWYGYGGGIASYAVSVGIDPGRAEGISGFPAGCGSHRVLPPPSECARVVVRDL
jgi:L-alanine-DL-glutamate epimerase-like enolase superfamily enzyme